MNTVDRFTDKEWSALAISRLNLRARQILSDPTLAQKDRIPNAEQLLKQLQANVRESPGYLDAVLSEIDDADVRASMRLALTT